MATNYFDYRAGLGNVGSYQSSGKPFLSASIDIPSNNSVIQIDFPNVTRFITIKHTGADEADLVDMRVGFSANGISGNAQNNWLILNNQESYSADWRVKSVYLRVEPIGGSTNATASVIAGLTTIDQVELSHNWTGSEGVG